MIDKNPNKCIYYIYYCYADAKQHLLCYSKSFCSNAFILGICQRIFCWNQTRKKSWQILVKRQIKNIIRVLHSWTKHVEGVTVFRWGWSAKSAEQAGSALLNCSIFRSLYFSAKKIRQILEEFNLDFKYKNSFYILSKYDLGGKCSRTTIFIPSDWDSVQQGTFCVSLEAWINVFPSCYSAPCNRESSYYQSFLPLSTHRRSNSRRGVRKPMFTLQCKKRSRSPLGKNWG